MTRIITYLTFSGNCREAMTFYHECFGGELSLQTIGDTSGAARLPFRMQNYVLQARLRLGQYSLIGTDMAEESGLKRGNAISILVECNSGKEIQDCFKYLSSGGKVQYPIELTREGDLFGALTDKFGNQWLLNFSEAISHHQNVK